MRREDSWLPLASLCYPTALPATHLISILVSTRLRDTLAPYCPNAKSMLASHCPPVDNQSFDDALALGCVGVGVGVGVEEVTGIGVVSLGFNDPFDVLLVFPVTGE